MSCFYIINKLQTRDVTPIGNSFYRNIVPNLVTGKVIRFNNIEKYYVVNLVIPTDLAILLWYNYSINNSSRGESSMEQFTIRLPKELMESIKLEAKKHDRSINFILNEIIKNYYNKKGLYNGK